MPFSRISRDPYQHPAPIIGVPFFGSANNAGTSSGVTLDSGVEGAKYDGDALLRECFNWQESRYVRDMPIGGGYLRVHQSLRLRSRQGSPRLRRKLGCKLPALPL